MSSGALTLLRAWDFCQGSAEGNERTSGGFDLVSDHFEFMMSSMQPQPQPQPASPILLHTLDGCALPRASDRSGLSWVLGPGSSCPPPHRRPAFPRSTPGTTVRCASGLPTKSYLSSDHLCTPLAILSSYTLPLPSICPPPTSVQTTKEVDDSHLSLCTHKQNLPRHSSWRFVGRSPSHRIDIIISHTTALSPSPSPSPSPRSQPCPALRLLLRSPSSLPPTASRVSHLTLSLLPSSTHRRPLEL